MTGNRDRKQRFAADLEPIQRQLFAYIFALLRNLDDAQEVFQQTCLVMWQKYDEFAGRSEFRTWACGIARNKTLQFRDQQRRHQSRFSSAFEDEIAALQMRVPETEIDDRRQALDSCIEKLHARERQLIGDCYGGTRSVAEVAEQLGRSRNSVYNSLRRIRQRLLECIDRATAEGDRA